MNGTPQAAAPRRVTVIPADPQMARQDIRKKHLRVAPYCRVSTDKEEQLSSYEAQIEYYTDKINSNPDWTMVRLYADEGITGTSAKKRKDFLKMVRDCQRGKIDLVITKSVSRFCRITLEGTRIPTVEEVAQMLDYANPTLRAAEFAPYYLYRQKYMSGSFENVGWCKSGGTGWYNIYIMEELHSILSLGAGGSTKMVDSAHDRIERVFNLKFPQEYIQRPEKIAENQRAFRVFYERMG